MACGRAEPSLSFLCWFCPSWCGSNLLTGMVTGVLPEGPDSRSKRKVSMSFVGQDCLCSWLPWALLTQGLLGQDNAIHQKPTKMLSQRFHWQHEGLRKNNVAGTDSWKWTVHSTELTREKTRQAARWAQRWACTLTRREAEQMKLTALFP